MMNAKISLKDDNVHYMTKNYVLKPIYNDENECINDTLSADMARDPRICNMACKAT